MAEKFVTIEQLDKFREEVRAYMGEMLELVSGMKSSGFVESDEPEIAPRKGKSFYGEKFDLLVRVDRNLAELLIEHSRRDYGGNISRTLDVVLWRFYDRPKLSWEGKNNGKK